MVVVGLALPALLCAYSAGWHARHIPFSTWAQRSLQPLLSADAWVESSKAAGSSSSDEGVGDEGGGEMRSASMAAWEVGLLPFSLTEALLPGETKQVHLFEARFLSLFEAAAKNHNMLGQLLVTPGGNVAAVSSLIEVEESRRKDIGVWAQLKCVGRIKLLELQGTDFDWVKARVQLVTDVTEDSTKDSTEDSTEGSTEDPKAGLESAVAEERRLCEAVRDTFATCCELRAKLPATATLEGDDDAGAAEAGGEEVEWGHEVSSANDFKRGLAELLEARRQVLSSRGPDAPPANTWQEGLGKVWGVSGADAAERQLVSFAALSAMGAKDRAQALGIQDTSERLNLALGALQERQRRLAAQVALLSVGAESSE